MNWDWGKVLELVMRVDVATEVGTLIRTVDIDGTEAKKWFSRFVVKSSSWEKSEWHGDGVVKKQKKRLIDGQDKECECLIGERKMDVAIL